MEPGAVAASYRAGTIAIIGCPNAGKSTLLNALVGSHVSITSDKPQTTRHRIMGVATAADAQFVFVDTPGLQHRHRNLLTRRMNAGVAAAIDGVDAIVVVVDARHGWSSADDALLPLLAHPRTAMRVLLALNKTDLLCDKAALLPLIATAATRFPFAAVVPVSAARHWQLADLLAALRPLLPESPPLFEADAITDRSLRFLATELIREQAFRLLGDELPFGLAVAIESWDESAGRAVLAARIVVERASQRGIVIGAGGGKLRQIGSKARSAIERLLGKPVYLQTHVRVDPGWNNSSRALDALGLEAPCRS